MYTPELIAHYAKPVPRYTSYPTAPHFHDGVGRDTHENWLSALNKDHALSLYIHIPYCDRLCWFCGCNTKQTLRYSPITTYLKSLYQEIELIGAKIGGGVVKQLHLGGGSPSMLIPEDFSELKSRLQDQFTFSRDAQISIEIDPSDMTMKSLEGFASFGMTRASIGVQDFDPQVQAAINRPQTFEDTKHVVEALRSLGIHSLNIDALYGLPFQTLEKVQNTLDQVISLSPDRIAMFGYAHVPWMKTHQRMIDDKSLPDIHARFEHARAAEEQISNNGYRVIGIDHFAKPEDSLALAHAEGRLRRNFQGYTDDPYDALIGMGGSSISDFPQGFIQNITSTGNYKKAINNGELATAKGYKLSGDDALRRAVIESLMCNFVITRSDLLTRFGDTANIIFTIADAMVKNEPNGYFIATDDGYTISEDGQPFTRSFAAQFDKFLTQGTARYSIAI